MMLGGCIDAHDIGSAAPRGCPTLTDDTKVVFPGCRAMQSAAHQQQGALGTRQRATVLAGLR